MSAARRIGILAGGGTLPREIADSLTARGIPVHIVALDGEANADFGPYPVTRVNWGEIGRMVSTFKETACTDLVIIGSVKRPDLAAVKPDRGFVAALGTVLGLVLAGGDDSVLRGVIAFFEGHGFRVASPAELVPELVIGSGELLPCENSLALLGDAQAGFDIIAALGRFDIGQAAVVCNGQLEALEAAEGTDRMLQRLAAQRLARQRRAEASASWERAGVLVKRAKPAQDSRIDLPAIGPETVSRAVDCALGGIVVEAGYVIAANRSELISRAQLAHLCITGVSLAKDGAGVRRRAGRGRMSWSGRLLAAIRARRQVRQLPMQKVGRHAMPSRVLRDAKKGLEVMAALKPFGGSRAVVVVRGHVLAVETGEGVASALGRAAGLRQWGDTRLKRRAGTVVIDAGRDCMPELIEHLKHAGFAGLVVKLRRFTAGVPADTIAEADKAGVFIVGVAADEEHEDG